MKNGFTEQSQKIMELAQDEARQLNHDYVGTEHILLALLIERPGALVALDVSAEAIRPEIEKLVMRGSTPPSAGEIPLTPRARVVIDYARIEAINHSQNLIEPEHLLVGLMHEPDGVAGQVMRSLGLDLRQVHEKNLKLRLAQMKIVERAVRPVRAEMARKRKMREELLAHLTEIFEEEQSRVNDPEAALAEAAKRFGDPVQLSRELQGALTAEDRGNYHVEHWMGWRPPESAARMMLRVSLLSFSIIACLAGMAIVASIISHGWHQLDLVAVRTFFVLAMFTPAAQFLVGICYYKTRDSLWGVFGSKKSLGNGILGAGLASLCVLGFATASIIVMNDSIAPIREFGVQMIAISIVFGVACFIIARVRGPREIRDTIWSCLDLEATS